MKKAILFLGTILFANLGFSQFLTTGTLTTDNKYRSGGIGIGYTTLPTFGTNKFMVNGNSAISGNLGLGTTSPLSKLHIPVGNIRVDAGLITIGNLDSKKDKSSVSLKSKIGLYPNPNNGSFQLLNIKSEEFESTNIQLQVFDLNGRNLYKRKLNDHDFTSCKVDLNHLSSGIYIVKLSSENHSVDIKFIKN